MNCRMFCAAASALAISLSAHAGVAIVDRIGGPVELHSKRMPSLFGAASPSFTNNALAGVHADLQSDGIVTDGRITILLAQTGDAGLAFMALIDDENQDGDFQNVDSVLGLSSTGPSTASVFVNDEPQDILFRQDLGNGTILATGLASWDSARDGDGFAWGVLRNGDYLSFSFVDRGAGGLTGAPVFQFASWTGSSWDVIATSGFSSTGRFTFTTQIVPAPGAIAALGLGAVVCRRRRRSA